MKGKIITTVFILLLAASAIAFGRGNDGANDENRTLATPPPFNRNAVHSGEFMAGAEAYVNDHIAYRNELIDIAQRIDGYRGIASPAGTIIRADVDMGTGVQQVSDILVENGKVTEMFKMDTETVDRFAAAINAYAEILDGTDMYVGIIPTQLEFAEPIYSNLEDSQSEAIEYIYSRLNSDITCIDIRSALAPHTDEYIYFRTDHHWTMRGAYYGYLALCEAALMDSVDIDDYEMHEMTDFHGYLSDFVSDKSLITNPDVLEWYDIDKAGTISNSLRAYDKDGSWHTYHTPVFYNERNDYDFFLGADHPLAVYRNSAVKNGRTILVISDSFINALAPWLMKTYSRVVLINPRSYYSTLKAAADEFKPDDALVLDYTFAATFADYCTVMENLE